MRLPPGIVRGDSGGNNLAAHIGSGCEHVTSYQNHARLAALTSKWTKQYTQRTIPAEVQHVIARGGCTVRSNTPHDMAFEISGAVDQASDTILANNVVSL